MLARLLACHHVGIRKASSPSMSRWRSEVAVAVAVAVEVELEFVLSGSKEKGGFT